MDVLKRAVALDPDFAQAWMALWDVYRNAGTFIAEPPGKSWTQLAEEALAQARRSAPDAFFILFSDIDGHMRRGEWRQAAELLDEIEAKKDRQGLQADLAGSRGFQLWVVGRVGQAVVHMERARDRDPLDGNRSAILGDTYAAAGDLPAAFAEFDRGLKTQQHIRLLGNALTTALATKDRALIEARLDAFVAAKGAGWQIHAAMKPLLSQPAQGLAELRRFSAGSQSPQVQAAAGVWAAYFGDAEMAFSLLNTPTLRANTVEFTRFWRPVARDVRRLPAFRQLVRDMGLVDYWRESGWPDLCKPVGADDFECS